MGIKRKPGFFGKLILLGGLLSMGALLLSYLAPVVNPNHFWPIAFFGIGYMPILILNLLFLIYWAIRKRWIALFSFALILAGWPFLTRHIGFHGSPSAAVLANPDTANIRLLTYNIHLFRGVDDDMHLTNKDSILSIVKEISPDIICFEEFYTRIKGKHKTIKSVMESAGLSHYYFYPNQKNDYEQNGEAIFSRYPIIDTGYVKLMNSNRSSRMIYVDLLRNGQKFRVYCVHLRSIGFQPEDYEFINNADKTNDEVMATKRIGKRLKWAFTDRGEEAVSLRKHADSCQTPYLIAGDFNDTPMSYAVSQISKGMKNCFKEKGSGWGVTYNGDFPNFQIDYILASSQIQVKHYQIISKKISDHNPVWADLSLK
ncbi:Metal-dependent hydrolase, endonuclease/exonuclease/phosphatase family [bacterium A37T11]|nr:Metal-dependent hydrolase, endonuclease/exonuclease/phosphatase family [bacterium A37T11]